MDTKLKLGKPFRRYTRWPLYLSILLIVINVFVYLINVKAGLVVSAGLVMYIAVSAALYFYHKPLILNDVIYFANQYDALERRILEELALPYALLDMKGNMVWSNKLFSDITGRDQFYRKSVTTVFPEITADKLPVPEKKEK